MFRSGRRHRRNQTRHRQRRVDNPNRRFRDLLLRNQAVQLRATPSPFIDINGVRYSHVVIREPIGLTQHIMATVSPRAASIRQPSKAFTILVLSPAPT